MIDPVLDTLLLPFKDGLIDWPNTPEDGHALFLRARYGHALQNLDKTRLIADQSFRPDFDTLKRAGFAVRDTDDGATYPLVLVLPPRQREEYRALLARAVQTTQPGGIVLACVSNLEGAKTVENDLKALTGNVASLSKNKCRAFWATVDAGRDTALIEAWAQLDAPRPVVEGRFISRPGLFAWDRLDEGSQLLVKNLPALSGVGADLGGGFGYLTDEVLRKFPGVTRIDLYEAERRALDSATENLKGFGERVDLHWTDVTKGLSGGISGGLDFIVANPPFHTGRADRNELGQAFIRSAAAALKPGGVFYMVANRHLPYEETLKAAFRTAILLAENTHYKVYKAIKGNAK